MSTPPDQKILDLDPATTLDPNAEFVLASAGQNNRMKASVMLAQVLDHTLDDLPPVVDSFHTRRGDVVLQSSDLNGLDGSGLSGIGTGTGGIINTGTTTIGGDSDSDGVGVIAMQTRSITREQIANDGAHEFLGQPAPALSTSGQGRIYFDAVLKKLMLSQNGGPYVSVARAGGPVNVAEFATSGAGTSASPWKGWDTAITWGVATYYFPSGVYEYSTSPNFAFEGIRLYGDGPDSTILRFTGTGVMLKADAGASSPTVCMGWTLEQLQIVGSATATSGIYLRSVHHVWINNVKVRNCTGAALETHFSILGVLNNFHVSQNEEPFTTAPATGIYFGERSPSEPTTCWTVLDAIIEGTASDGIILHTAHNCVFITGTSEGNGGRGVLIDAESVSNTFMGMDNEANGDDDWTDNGTYTQLINCISVGVTRFGPTSKFATVSGGVFNTLFYDPACVNPIICNHPAVNVTGSGGLAGGGTNNADFQTPLHEYFPPYVLIGPSYKTPVFTNGWVNFGGATSIVLFRRTSGRVYFQGTMKSGTLGAVAFTLPAAWRPLGTRSWMTAQGNVVVVTQAGTVTVTTGANTQVDLEGIQFDAAI